MIKLRVAMTAAVLIVVAAGCGDGDVATVASGPSADQTSAPSELPVENVDLSASQFNAEDAVRMEQEFQGFPVEYVAPRADVAVRVVLEPVSEVLGDYPSAITGEGRSPNAFVVQRGRVVELLGTSSNVDDAHLEALASGDIDLVLSGLNVLSDEVVSAVRENRVALPESGTGALPEGVELLLFLRPTSFPSELYEGVNSDHQLPAAFQTASGPVSSFFYWGAETLVRPTLPLVSDLPGLELTDVNRASIREASPFRWEDYGLSPEVPTAEAVEAIEQLGSNPYATAASEG